MALPAYRQQLAAAISTLPVTPSISLYASNDNDPSDPFARFTRLHKHFLAHMTQWRATVVAKIDHLDTIISRARTEDEAFVLPLLAMVQELVLVFERQISEIEPSDEFDAQLRDILPTWRELRPSTAKRFERQWTEGKDATLDALNAARDRALSVIWRHDPEARDGTTFENANDLLTFLKS